MVRRRAQSGGMSPPVERKKNNDKLECKYCKLRLRFDAE